MIEFFGSGGPVMYLLALCSVAALAITFEKTWNLRRSKILPSKSYEALLALIEGGRVDKARDICRQNPGVFHNIVSAGLDSFHYGREEVKEAIVDAGRQEIPHLERYLSALGTIAGIAPLLGLLGTVIGMIKVFGVISALGVGHAQDLAEGISEALITTATGLPIAIFALVMYNYFSSKAEGIILEMEKYSLGIIKQLFRTRTPEPRAGTSPVPIRGER